MHSLTSLNTAPTPLIAGSSSFESQKMERPSLHVLSPSSPGMLQDAAQLMPGQLSVSVCDVEMLQTDSASEFCACVCTCVFPTKVKLWYDKVGHQLIVNVLQAVELPLRPDGRPRSPYVKMYFLPDRRYASHLVLDPGMRTELHSGQWQDSHGVLKSLRKSEIRRSEFQALKSLKFSFVFYEKKKIDDCYLTIIIKSLILVDLYFVLGKIFEIMLCCNKTTKGNQ